MKVLITDAIAGQGIKRLVQACYEKIEALEGVDKVRH